MPLSTEITLTNHLVLGSYIITY